jgi:hypothetical protein
MSKSSNYSESDFEKISLHLETTGIKTIDQLEKFAVEMNRDVWSLYSFIKRKLCIEVFEDKKIKREFRLKYSCPVPRKKKEKKSPAKIISMNTNSNKRPPAVYSNVDVIKWAEDLLKDD